MPDDLRVAAEGIKVNPQIVGLVALHQRLAVGAENRHLGAVILKIVDVNHGRNLGQQVVAPVSQIIGIIAQQLILRDGLVEVGHLGGEVVELLHAVLQALPQDALLGQQIIIYGVQAGGQYFAFLHHGNPLGNSLGIVGQVLPGIPEFANHRQQTVVAGFVESPLQIRQGAAAGFPHAFIAVLNIQLHANEAVVKVHDPGGRHPGAPHPQGVSQGRGRLNDANLPGISRGVDVGHVVTNDIDIGLLA